MITNINTSSLKYSIFLTLILSIFSSFTVQAENGYLGFGYGVSTLSDGLKDSLYDGSIITAASADDSDTSISLFIGFPLNSFNLEIGYINFGTMKANGFSDGSGIFWFAGPVEVSADSTAFTLSAVGESQINTNINFIWKFGMYRADTTVDAADTCCTLSFNETNTDFLYGLGVSSGLSETTTARLIWTKFSNVGGNDVGGEDDISVVEANVVLNL